MRLKKVIRYVSMVLAVIVLATSLPLSAYALIITPTDEADTWNGVYELTHMRTANTKYFRLKNGSIYAAHYDTAVHYPAADGTWQDINNSVSLDQEEVVNADGTVSFARRLLASDRLLTLGGPSEAMTLSLPGANRSAVAQWSNLQDEQSDGSDLEALTTLTDMTALVTYADILENTDIRYTLHGGTVKENIVIKSRASLYSYTFELTLSGLYAEWDPTRQAVVVRKSSTHAVAYVIEAPVMFDAAGACSDAITLTLQDVGNGRYTLSVTPDAAWINDGERVFPVTVDPPIYGSTYDVTDLSVSPYDYPSPSDTVLMVGDIHTAYWKANTLPRIPATAYISDATITLYGAAHLANETCTVGAYEVLTDWDSTLTYSDMDGYAEYPGMLAESYVDTESYYSGTEMVCTFTITPLVRKWYNGENYGVAFARPDADGSGDFHDSGDYLAARFHSSEGLQATRPTLCITFQDMNGMEDYWSFISQSAGFAGEGAVNLATGNLVFSIPTLSTLDGLMPTMPALVYNSGVVNVPSAQSFVPSSDPFFTSFHVKGVSWSVMEYVSPYYVRDYNGTLQQAWMWVDGDGTSHVFLPSDSESGITTYKDTDGLHLTMELTSATLTIRDDADTVRTFAGGNSAIHPLVSMTDKSGNALLFTYENDRLVAISLQPVGMSPIVQLKLLYRNGMPCAVLNPTSGEAALIRYTALPTESEYEDPSYLLTSVLRAHGTASESAWADFAYGTSVEDTATITVDAVATYTYSADNRLTSVTNGLTGYTVTYGYTGQRVTTVTESAPNGETAVTGQTVSISYGTSSAVVRTSGKDDVHGNADDLLTTYTFDSEGRTANCYTTDLSRTRMYGTSSAQYENSEAAKNSIKTSVQSSGTYANWLDNGGFEDYSSGSFAHWEFWSANNSVSLGYSTDSVTGNYAASLSFNQSKLVNGKGYATLTQYTYFKKGAQSLSFMLNSYRTSDIDVSVYVQYEDISDEGDLNTDTLANKATPVNKVNASGGYHEYSVEFTSAITGYGFIKINIQGTPESGSYILLDNLMLSASLGAAEFNMLQNGHFEYGNAKDWVNNVGSAITTAPVNTDTLFGKSLKLGTGSTVNVASQTVYTIDEDIRYEYQAGDRTPTPQSFTLSGWAKGTAQTYGPSGMFFMEVTVEYENATEHHSFSFDKGLTDWQYASGGFTTNPDNGYIYTITVTLFYLDNPGTAYFDEICLMQDSTSTINYTYNAYGYPTSAMSGGIQTLTVYDEDNEDESKRNNVLHTASTDGSIVKYEYDSLNRVIRQTNMRFHAPSGTIPYNYEDIATTDYVTEYFYNSFGLTVSTSTYAPYNTSLGDIISTTVYRTEAGSPIFGVTDRELDSLGNITRYMYNESNGRLIAVINPKGNAICYTYDAIGNLTQTHTGTYTESTNTVTANASGTAVSNTFDPVTNRLTAITTESTTYTFTYDPFGNTEEIAAGNYTLVSYTSHPNNGKVATMTYGGTDDEGNPRGLVVKYVYDVLDRVSEIQYNIGENKSFETVYSYSYDSGGRLNSVTDHRSQRVTRYLYNAHGNPVQTLSYDSSTHTVTNAVHLYYDSQQRVEQMDFSFDYTHSTGNASEQLRYSYQYGSKDLLSNMYIRDGAITVIYTPIYDSFDRLKGRTVTYEKSGATRIATQDLYTYETNGDGQSSNRIQSHTINVYVRNIVTPAVSSAYSYSYDANGNIIQVNDASGVLYRYEYDSLDQLIREDNRLLNKSFTYTYDTAGNMTSKKTYAYTTETLGSVTSTQTYSYTNPTWGDLLTSVNGEPVTYDAVGNPLQIGIIDLSGGGNVGRIFSWEGRLLTQVNYFQCHEDLLDEYPIGIYTYNADGIRTSKTDEFGITHTYTLNGTQILAETWTQNNIEHMLLFVYDEQGAPIGLRYRNSTYAQDVYDYYVYEKNLQGDVIGIYAENGTKICTYQYDAWGNVTRKLHSTTNAHILIADTNPFRYRGYYYDTETGYYYLQSRYYVPQWGRFLTADDASVITATPEGFTDKNLIIYCDNNPVTRVDEDGDFWNTIIGAVSGALIGGVTAAIMGTDIKAGAVSGAISGGIAGAALDIAIATGGAGLVAFAGVALASGLGSATGSYVNQRMNGTKHEDVDWGTIVTDGIWGAIGGAISFGVADVGGATCKTLKQILSQPIKQIGKQAADDFVSTSIITAGTWFNGTKLNSMRQGKVTFSQLY